MIKIIRITVEIWKPVYLDVSILYGFVYYFRYVVVMFRGVVVVDVNDAADLLLYKMCLCCMKCIST